MEPSSTSPCRGCVPWQGLLLAASLLTLWSPPTTAQLTVLSVPSNVAEGEDVFLLVQNLPEDLTEFRWYKGDRTVNSQLIGSYVIATLATIPGPAYSHRETMYPDGSLLFQNVTQEDTGSYTLEIIKMNLKNIEATVQFRVYHENASGLPARVIAGIVIGVLLGVALMAALGYFLVRTRTERTGV